MELITVSQTIIGQSAVNAVNSRELYEALGLAKGQYSRWAEKNIIEPYCLNEDYIGVRHDVEGNNITTFIVTIELAKHLAMMARTEKGKQIRDYFLECEKKAHSPQFQIPQTYSEALRLAADLSDENIKLHSVIKQKDEVILAVADLNIRAGDISIGDFSKNLAIENLGRNNLFAWLKARGFLMMNTEPYQPYVERGYFVRKPSDKRVNGEVKYTTMLTAKGSVWLTKMLRAEFNLED